MSKTPTCHWETNAGWLTPEHLRDCKDRGCVGCRPCPEAHCAMRGTCPNHVNADAGLITCPTCIGKVRAHLRLMGQLYAIDLPREAEHAGVDSEALNLAGPAASAEQVDARRRWDAINDTLRGWCAWPTDNDPHHPLRILGDWDLRLRDTYGPPTQLVITVDSAIHYLTSLLAGPFPHGPEFDAFAKSIAKGVAHMEAVLHDSRAPETGRPCPRCAELRGKGQPLRKRYANHDRTGASDTWHCPDDTAHWWTEHDYRSRVATDYVAHAQRLPIKDIAARLGIAASTIRRWASAKYDVHTGLVKEPPKLKPKGKVDGLLVYDITEVEALRVDTTPQPVSKLTRTPVPSVPSQTAGAFAIPEQSA